jgi:hypothetical protein
MLDIIHGPERIEDCWWSKPTSRDYYIAQTPQKQPIWLYQDRHNPPLVCTRAIRLGPLPRLIQPLSSSQTSSC